MSAALVDLAGRVDLLRPWWLLVLPLVALLAVVVRRPGDLGDWQRAVDPALLALMAARGAVLPPAGPGRRLSPWLAAAGLAGLALAGPALERTERDSFRNLDGLVIALDMSRSMAATGALADAGIGALELVAAAADRQAALVLYAGDAYPATPFTADPAALRPLLVATPADMIPEAGSDPGRALAAVRDLFAASRMIGGDAVLATDGGGIDGTTLTEARQLAADGKRLHVLFSPGTPVLDRPPPDRAAALALATAGGGVFADVANPQPIVAALTAGTAARLGASGYGALFFRDYGRLLLALAAMPMLLLFRRGG